MISRTHHARRTIHTLSLRGVLSLAIAAAFTALLAAPGCGDLAKINCIGICEHQKKAECGAKIPADTDCGAQCDTKAEQAGEIGCLDAYQKVLLQCETDSCGELAKDCDKAVDFLSCYADGCQKHPDAAACKPSGS
jgi:hypothetical protein